MDASMFRWSLREKRLSCAVWSLGALALTLPILAIWPTVRDSPELREFLDQLPRFLLHLLGVDPDRFFSGAGFAEAQFLTIFAPLVMALWCIGLGATATAGDEETGRLEVLLGHPLSRGVLLGQRFAALVVLALPVACGFGLSLAIGSLAFDMGIEPVGILGAVLALWLCGLAYGTIALAIGSATGDPGTAVFGTSMLVLLSFLMVGLAPLSQPVATLARWLPHHWYLTGEVLIQGPGRRQAVQLVFVAVPLLLAWYRFRSRDLGSSGRLLGDWWRRTTARPRPRGLVGARLWLERPADLGWFVAMILVTVLTLAFWPILRDRPRLIAGLLERVPKEVFQAFGVKDPATLMTAGGFITSRVHSGIGMILMLVVAIGRATRVLAGEEESGRLELLLSAPLSRPAWLWAQSRALAVELALLAALPTAVLLVADPVLSLAIGTGRILAAGLGFLVLGLTFASLAFALGGLGLGTARARGITIGVAIVAFVLNILGVALAGWHWLALLSPLSWYLGDSPPLTRGLGWGLLPLAALAAVAMLVAARGFAGRDLGRG